MWLASFSVWKKVRYNGTGLSRRAKLSLPEDWNYNMQELTFTHRADIGNGTDVSVCGRRWRLYDPEL